MPIKHPGCSEPVPPEAASKQAMLNACIIMCLLCHSIGMTMRRVQHLTRDFAVDFLSLSRLQPCLLGFSSAPPGTPALSVCGLSKPSCPADWR